MVLRRGVPGGPLHLGGGPRRRAPVARPQQRLRARRLVGLRYRARCRRADPHPQPGHGRGAVHHHRSERRAALAAPPLPSGQRASAGAASGAALLRLAHGVVGDVPQFGRRGGEAAFGATYRGHAAVRRGRRPRAGGYLRVRPGDPHALRPRRRLDGGRQPPARRAGGGPGVRRAGPSGCRARGRHRPSRRRGTRARSLLADAEVEQRGSEFGTVYSAVACPGTGELWYTFGGYPAASRGDWRPLPWP